MTLKRDVDYDLVYYLRENQARYPGVSVQHVYVRNYPNGSLAAQIFGYVREVTEEQLKEARYQGLVPGDQVGQSGVENTYDNVLRGSNGMTRVQVDAQGRPTGGVLSQTQPRAGDNLLLTIDSRVQEAGEAALGGFSTPGAFVAMNVRDGEILGLGSSPTYDPSVFTKPVIPQSTIDQIFSDEAGSPYTNRATQGLYPTGSTFKPITAVAALESGVLTPTTTIVDGGTFTIGGLSFKNAGGAAYGALQLPEALQVSSDVFFYNLGADLYEHDDAQQHWASELGIGHPTGIDIPGEGAGLLPTPEWRNQLYNHSDDPDSPGGADVVIGETDRPWTVGDNVNLAVGQGDLQANPLQMAVAYAAIANGGDVVRPHVGMEVEDASGRAVQEIDPAPQRHVEIAPQYRQAILRGRSHGRAVAGRDLVLGVRQLPDPDGRQDGDRGAHRPGGPVVVRGTRPVSQPRDRGCGDDRAGGLRRRRRGARGLPGSSRPTTAPRAPARRRPGRSSGEIPAPVQAPRRGAPTNDGLRRLSPSLRRAPRGRGSRARRHARPRPGAPARHPRAGRLRPLHAGRGDGRRRPPRALLTTSFARRSTR